jgi:hypothetical protein
MKLVWPPPEATPRVETIDFQYHDLICTTDPTKIRAFGLLVGVQYVGGKAYGKATAFYNKRRKHSEQWNLWHPSMSAYALQ